MTGFTPGPVVFLKDNYQFPLPLPLSENTVTPISQQRSESALLDYCPALTPRLSEEEVPIAMWELTSHSPASAWLHASGMY